MEDLNPPIIGHLPIEPDNLERARSPIYLHGACRERVAQQSRRHNIMQQMHLRELAKIAWLSSVVPDFRGPKDQAAIPGLS